MMHGGEWRDMLDAMLATQAFSGFHAAMKALAAVAPMSHTMIGFNYRDGKVVSTKFYYVFLDDVSRYGDFPLPGLARIYGETMAEASALHLQTRLLPGAGLTLALKFDAALNVSRGFFVRTTRRNDALKERIVRLYPEFRLEAADFDEGYGQYVMASGDTISTSEYVYLKNVAKLKALDDAHGAGFSRAGCVEISAAGSDDKAAQKFIAIGLDELIGPGFRAQVPDGVTQGFAGMDCQLCCPAVQPLGGQYSVYVIGRLKDGEFSCSPVDELVRRRGGAA